MPDFVLFKEDDTYGQCETCGQLSHTEATVDASFEPVCLNSECDDKGQPLTEITYEEFMDLVE